MLEGAVKATIDDGKINLEYKDLTAIAILNENAKNEPPRRWMSLILPWDISVNGDYLDRTIGSAEVAIHRMKELYDKAHG